MKEKLLVLDNYDSFTYNILHILKAISVNTINVCKNNEIVLTEIASYKNIILSPGPGLPEKGSILRPLIKYYSPIKNILGICLGQQAIADVFGGKLINTNYVYHGSCSKITVIDNEEKIFFKLPTYLTASRYHSWIISECNFPPELKITARGPKGEIMALSHNNYNLFGVQFHPESILTPKGGNIIYNWFKF